VRLTETTRTPRASNSILLDVNYELFNCNNDNICYWSWNYRGCWHQTCPPIVPPWVVCVSSIPNAAPDGHRTGISCHNLAGSTLGMLRACCLPWEWQPSLVLPLRRRTLIPRTRGHRRSPRSRRPQLIGQRLVRAIGARVRSDSLVSRDSTVFGKREGLARVFSIGHIAVVGFLLPTTAVVPKFDWTATY